MIEYVILIYATGTVTTVIGFAERDTAISVLDEKCALHSANWGYLYKADGTLIASYS